MDKIAFRRPVEIGDLIRIKSKVVSTTNAAPTNGQPKAVVEVFCQVVKPEKYKFLLRKYCHSITVQRVL